MAINRGHRGAKTDLRPDLEDPRTEILVGVDYGYGWPMSTIFWDEEEEPDWDKLLPKKLIEDLKAWAKFFDDHANEETGLFGSEELRKHFDLEGVRLRDELEKAAGEHYRFRLDLWF